MLGKAIDVWALGVTLYCFLYGRVPFESPSGNTYEVYHRIRTDEYGADAHKAPCTRTGAM
jgi:serine/threonine protein kinase